MALTSVGRRYSRSDEDARLGGGLLGETIFAENGSWAVACSMGTVLMLMSVSLGYFAEKETN